MAKQILIFDPQVEPKAKEVLVELQKTHPDEMVTFTACSTDNDNDVIKKCLVTADSKQEQEEEVTNNSSIIE